MYGDLFGMYTKVVIAANSRSQADRLRGLGWEPKHFSVRDAFKQEELPILLREDLGVFAGYTKPSAS